MHLVVSCSFRPFIGNKTHVFSAVCRKQNTRQKVLYLLLRTGNVGVLKGRIDVGSPRRSFSSEAGNFCQYVRFFVLQVDVTFGSCGARQEGLWTAAQTDSVNETRTCRRLCFRCGVPLRSVKADCGASSVSRSSAAPRTPGAAVCVCVCRH